MKRDEPETPDEPEVVIINEAQQVTPDPPPPVEQPPFQFQETESVLEEPEKEKVFETKNEFASHEDPYQPDYSYERESPEIWPKVLGFLLVLLLAGAAIWYFAYYRPQQLAEEEKERKELLEIQEEARRKEAARLAEEKRVEDEQKTAVTVAEAAPKVGAIETLSGRSGRYYVVVASAIDGDLIMDYAKKLSAKGVSTKIIPPFGKSKFHRIAVAEGDTYAATQASADGLKGGEYGDKVWVVKY